MLGAFAACQYDQLSAMNEQILCTILDFIIHYYGHYRHHVMLNALSKLCSKPLIKIQKNRDPSE